MGAEVEADLLGDDWKGYVVRIAGGNDKQGFPMKQGVLTNSECPNIKNLCFCLRPWVTRVMCSIIIQVTQKVNK